MNYITREQIKKNPDILFIFYGDDFNIMDHCPCKYCENAEKLSELEKEPNVFIIRLKNTDDYHKENLITIQENIQKIKEVYKDYIVMYVPDDIGKELKKSAKMTYNSLIDELLKLRKWGKK